MSFRVVVAFLVALSAVAYAQDGGAFKHPDACKKVKPVKINIEQSGGKWFDFIHSADLGYGCSVFTETFTREQNKLFQTITSKVRHQNGSVTEHTEKLPVPESNDGIYRQVSDEGNTQHVFAVLSTDYTGYSLSYFCVQHLNETLEMVFLNSRKETLPVPIVSKAVEVLKANGINHKLDNKPEACKGLF